MPESALRIEIYDHPKRIAKQWQALDESGGCTVFQSYAWATAWYDAVVTAGLATPLVVAVYRPDGSCLMVFALVLRVAGGLRTVTFADLGVADYNAPLVALDCALDARAMRALWRSIRAALPAHDWIFFEKMPLRCGTQPNPLLQLAGMGLNVQNCVGTRLEAAQGGDVTACFPSKFAEKMKDRARKLEKKAPVRLDMAADQQTVDRYLALFTQNFAEKSAIPGFNDVLGTVHWSQMYRASLAGDAPVGRVGALLIDGEEGALCYGLVHNGAYHLLLHTYLGQRWRNYSPGLQLIHRTMQWAVDQGLQYFDFTLGAESYKLEYGGTEYPLYQYVAAGSARGWQATLAARAKGVLRRFPRLLQRLKGILGRT